MPKDNWQLKDHRGHPSPGEYARASRMRPRLEAALDRLRAEGFAEREAVIWIAAIAYDKGEHIEGETWTSRYAAIITLDRLLDGRGAKHWSMDAINLALADIEDALR